MSGRTVLGTVAVLAFALAGAVGCSAGDDGSGSASTSKATTTSGTTTGTTTNTATTTSSATSTYAGFATADGACNACLPSAVDGPCAAQSKACNGSAACLDNLKCYESCLAASKGSERNNCMAACTSNGKDLKEVYIDYLSCICCWSQCAGECKGFCEGYENGPMYGPIYSYDDVTGKSGCPNQ